MAFYARKPFVYEGHQFAVGDVVGGFPDRFPKAEVFLRAGIVIEREEPVAPTRTKKVVQRRPRMTEVLPPEPVEV